MEIVQRLRQLDIAVGFSYFSQSYYYCFGYFAVLKTEYQAFLEKNPDRGGLIAGGA